MGKMCIELAFKCQFGWLRSSHRAHWESLLKKVADSKMQKLKEKNEIRERISARCHLVLPLLHFHN